MLNENKLKAKIIENNLSIDGLSRAICINKATFYRKMAKNSFSIKEVSRISKELNLSASELMDIFFA